MFRTCPIPYVQAAILNLINPYNIQSCCHTPVMQKRSLSPIPRSQVWACRLSAACIIMYVYTLYTYNMKVNNHIPCCYMETSYRCNGNIRLHKRLSELQGYHRNTQIELNCFGWTMLHVSRKPYTLCTGRHFKPDQSL